MTKPDVALISPFPPGAWTGVSTYSARLAFALQDAGARVVVLADGDGPTRHLPGVEVRRVWRRGASALPRAAAAAVATGAPAVHIQHELMLYGGPLAAPGVLPALALLRAARRRSVVTMHHVLDPAAVDAAFTATHHVSAPVPVARAGVRALQAGVRALADTVIVHEPEFATLLPGAKVIPHGIDAPAPSRAPATLSRAAPSRTPASASSAAATSSPPPAALSRRGASAPPAITAAGSSLVVARPHSPRAALGLDPDRVVALCFGFLAPYKGLELAIEAAREADAQLVLAGGAHPRAGDAYAERLRAQAAPGTRFTGFVPDADVAAWFAAADVALLLYPRPFATSGPLALALTHRTPVLMSPALARTTGAPPELAVELDARALGSRLRRLEDPDERAALRERTQVLAAGRTWPQVARAHLEVYA
jgi:glycosyltransferase involved in cell wall biosynthesis